MSTINDSQQDAYDYDLDALVVGAGFGGVYSLIRLRQLGLNVKVFEAGSGLGGKWHWNCYPGARVDSEPPIYQLDLPELYEEWSFKEKFPGWEELREYFEYVDRKMELKKDIVFNTFV